MARSDEKFKQREMNVLKDASKSANTQTGNPRKRGRPRRNRTEEVSAKKRPRGGESSSHLLLSSADEAPCSSSRDELVDDGEACHLAELWDYYVTRAEYQAVLTELLLKCPKRVGRSQTRLDIIEKMMHIKRIEQCISTGIRQVTTFEFFNYANPLCPGLNDVVTEIHMISCSANRVMQKDFVGSVVVPCRVTSQQKCPVVYYAVPPSLEKSAVNVYLVVKVHIEQRYHYIGPARRIGRSRRDVESDVRDFPVPVMKRVLYGVRRVAIGGRHGVKPEFGKHNVVLINNDTANVDGVSFNIAQEKWMWDCTHLAEFARIGKKLSSAGPIGLINFGISDEHVEYDWNMVKEVMDARIRRREEQIKADDISVWYHCKDAQGGNGTPTTTRCSPSSDKENCIVRPSSRRTPRSSQKSSVRTFSAQKASRSSTPSDATLSSGVLGHVTGLLCPFTRKAFQNVEELEEHLQCLYPVFKFEKTKLTSSVIHFTVSSVVSRLQWENPQTEGKQRNGGPLGAVSPPRKPRYAPPDNVPIRRRDDLPKAQMIPFSEMSFVPPTYSQVPGPSSSKVYHSVIEDTCDWKEHLMERNILDYIDDTPKGKNVHVAAQLVSIQVSPPHCRRRNFFWIFIRNLWNVVV
ncbi:hypothetical protein KIN20_029755 [Parelaphostrongylus tenuis]|uniref:Uncharacterized protein n=1 Tax=Parelaphostrongylus tenuis TaxID=148309 RepID=A0AAD5R304_PARTN|nr:hypothetical protein KIN20_029755 [Parelaphostrongylus tenuis]